MRKQLQKYVGDRVQGVRQKLLSTTDDDEAEKYKEVLKAYLKVELKVMSKKTIDNAADLVLQVLSATDFNSVEFDVGKDQLFNLGSSGLRDQVSRLGLRRSA
jgi:hypothetical protein